MNWRRNRKHTPASHPEPNTGPIPDWLALNREAEAIVASILASAPKPPPVIDWLRFSVER